MIKTNAYSNSFVRDFIYSTCVYLEKDCGIPLNGINTKAVPQQSLLYGDTYIYECIEGYEAYGGTVTTCGPDGMFTKSYPLTCYSE